MVDYDMLDAITDPQKALDSDAPLLHEGMESNLAFRWAGGNEVDEAFENADVVMELPILNQLLQPMIPRANGSPFGHRLKFLMPSRPTLPR